MKNLTFNKDCREVFKGLASECIDLAVTDCPYHIVQGGATIHQHKGNGIFENSNIKTGKVFRHNDIVFSEWLPDLYRVMKPQTHTYIFINSRNLKELWIEAEKAGFEYQNTLIWEKTTPTPNRYYMQVYECILMLKKGRSRTINNPGEKNILKCGQVRNRVHPTEKPIEILETLIKNSSNESDVVIDPFMGSGTTGIACHNLKRRFIGIEIDKQYYDIAVQRLFENR